MKNLAEAIEDWMVSYKKTSVKAATYDRMLYMLYQLEHYAISKVIVDKLTSLDIQNYVNELVEDGYSLSTIKKQFHLISEFVTYANLNDIILKPLHKGVKLPSESIVKKRKREVMAYDKEEQERLMKFLMLGRHPAHLSAALMMETGLRIGEVLALTWDNVDWNRKCLRVCKTIVLLGDSRHSFVQSGAKSFTSNRVIPLSATAYEILRMLRYNDDSELGYVFHNMRGEYLSYETVRYQIQKICSEANVPYLGQHVFRHTFATNCYNKGCDVKVLSKFLGHSDVTTTYNIYIHLFGDALEEMRSIVG